MLDEVKNPRDTTLLDEAMSCYFLREMHNAMTHIVKIILWDFLMVCLSYNMWVSHMLWPTKYERGALWDVLMRYFLLCMMVLCNLNGVFLTCYLISNTWWCFLWVFWDFSFLWFEKNLRYYTFYYITFAIWCGNKCAWWTFKNNKWMSKI